MPSPGVDVKKLRVNRVSAPSCPRAAVAPGHRRAPISPRTPVPLLVPVNSQVAPMEIIVPLTTVAWLKAVSESFEIVTTGRCVRRITVMNLSTRVSSRM